MHTVANRFESSMGEILSFIIAFEGMIQVAMKDPVTTTARTAFVRSAKLLHSHVNSSSRIDVVAYDGSFLHLCAEFELAVRDLIERYIDKAANKCPKYSHLPKAIRSWYPLGCAEVILKIDRGRFQHLTSAMVLQSLGAVARDASNNLVSEAFSYNERNFSAKMVEEGLTHRLGIEKIWKKVARDGNVQVYLGSANVDVVENLARVKLDTIIDRRNSIIHRGRMYYTSSKTEVIESVEFLRILIRAFADILEKQIAAI